MGSEAAFFLRSGDLVNLWGPLTALHSPFPATFRGSCVSPWAVHWDLAASPALPAQACSPKDLASAVTLPNSARLSNHSQTKQHGRTNPPSPDTLLPGCPSTKQAADLHPPQRNASRAPQPSNVCARAERRACLGR